MNAFESVVLKNIQANPQHVNAILSIAKAYKENRLEDVMVGDLEANDYFTVCIHEMTPAEIKAEDKFKSAVYKFHALDENLEYVNQDNHFKVYGYYEHN